MIMNDKTYFLQMLLASSLISSIIEDLEEIRRRDREFIELLERTLDNMRHQEGPSCTD